MPAAVTAPPSAPRRRFPLAALGLAAALVAFTLGVVHLFDLRFSLGDVYPPYSTLRADPLGAEVFYEALAAQPALGVERNLRPLNLLGKPPFGAPGRDAALDPGLTCFYLGAAPYEWPFLMDPGAVERLETIMQRGGRVVLTFQPATTPLTAERLRFAREEYDLRPGGSPAPSRRRADPNQPPDLIRRWHLDFRRTDPKARADDKTQPPAPTAANHARARPAPGLPLDPVPLSWHSLADFDLDAPAARDAGWTAFYACEGRPVIVARPFGERGGELIVCGDSYFLSNEAMRAEPHPALLAALVGPGRRVIFDENHLGIGEHPGLMTLARRYRLQGALAVLAALAALFVWRNVVSLVPPAASEPDPSGVGPTIPGRDSASGFLNLLRRGVPARDLPAACLAQWEQTQARVRGGASAPALERLRAVLREDTARAPAAAYRAMCKATKGANGKAE